LQSAIDTCTQFGASNAIEFNELKTVIMVYGKNKNTRTRRIEIKMNEKKLEQVSEAKYLGVMMTGDLKENSHIEERTNKFIKCTYDLERLGLRSNALSKNAKAQILKSFCRPVLLYGVENATINKGQLKDLKTQESLLVRGIFKLNKHSCTSEVLSAMRMDSMANTIEKAKLKFFVRMIQHPVTRILTINEIERVSELVVRNPKPQSLVEEVLAYLRMENDTNLSIEAILARIKARLHEIEVEFSKKTSGGRVDTISTCLDSRVKEEKVLLLHLVKPRAWEEYNPMIEEEYRNG
jgi:hypothetical protein